MPVEDYLTGGCEGNYFGLEGEILIEWRIFVRLFRFWARVVVTVKWQNFGDQEIKSLPEQYSPGKTPERNGPGVI